LSAILSSTEIDRKPSKPPETRATFAAYAERLTFELAAFVLRPRGQHGSDDPPAHIERPFGRARVEQLLQQDVAGRARCDPAQGRLGRCAIAPRCLNERDEMQDRHGVAGESEVFERTQNLPIMDADFLCKACPILLLAKLPAQLFDQLCFLLRKYASSRPLPISSKIHGFE
jgi:hypothetical protein